jgi:hypothetical protein
MFMGYDALHARICSNTYSSKLSVSFLRLRVVLAAIAAFNLLCSILNQ